MNKTNDRLPKEDAKPKSVKEWPNSEQPFVRLATCGVEALSDTELIAIMLRTGSGKQGVYEIAQNLARRSTEWLKKASVAELVTVPGIGEVRASQLVAMMEFGKRINAPVRLSDRPQVLNPGVAKTIFAELIGNKESEEMYALLLDVRGRIIKTAKIAGGGLQSATIEPRTLFREAVKANAASIILGHNHPSGDSSPSDADIESTRRLMEMGKLFGIPINDHIIVGAAGSRSLREDGLI